MAKINKMMPMVFSTANIAFIVFALMCKKWAQWAARLSWERII